MPFPVSSHQCKRTQGKMLHLKDANEPAAVVKFKLIANSRRKKEECLQSMGYFIFHNLHIISFTEIM